ncbi:chloramphenicol phosphotransferase CPT family protein [Kribbella sp. DT2]|uniref:chloramphenicol phosphotransferase CPT family protein n=1 Tax=Kribbella sp. DT2 TaxID=3393427 RepID=UPI003CEC83C2
MTSATHELLPEATDRPPGRVVFLNGTSSSGKSSVAEELLRTLDGPWYHLAVDHFHRIRSKHEWTDEEFLPIFQRTVRGFHRAVAGTAAAGNDVVVDHILGERWRLTDCLEVFAGLPVYLVGIHCPLPELERRERARGNRTVGRAAVQFPLVHQHLQYDVEVHTDQQSPAECATQIAERLRTPPTAFAHLQRQ